ncbi:MAG: type II secretion system inner membrane protein GspF [Gammaproteobacteria bacterium]|nr:type II secretion system inner membrane protein GspF [Gammaproteobacteria bacterium]
MGAYEYSALDPRGRTRKGVMEGQTARQVRARLRESDLHPLDVVEVERHSTRKPRSGLILGGLGANELALVTRQLATLTRAALPLEESLRVVAEQSEKARTRKIMLAVRAQVLEGHTLASGLDEFPASFSELFRATVAAGEQSGRLDIVLERLADYTEQRQQMTQKVRLALFYPALLTLMAVLVTGGLMGFVVPEVVKVFDTMGQQLPALTVGLIAVSDFLRDYGLVLVGAVALAAIALRYLLRLPGPRFAFHRLLLRLPLIARLVRGINAGRFARTLSILTASGVDVLSALRISGQVLTNQPMRRTVEQASRRVREGTSLSVALKAGNLFPPMMVQLIASGEATGELEAMLGRAADHQDREVEGLIATFLGLFEPLLILVMGAVVLVIVLAILLPIFDLNQLVK